MNKKRLTLVAMLLMIVFSFSGLLVLFGIDTNLASATLIIGIIFYFVTSKIEEREGMNIKVVPEMLRKWKLDVLILMPVITNIVCYTIAKIFLPEFFEHLLSRIDFLSFTQIIILIGELMISALGEEIAWRGFFLNRLSKKIPFSQSLIITSILFSICHFSMGDFIIVVYDLFFIIVNATFYGLIYKESHNIIVSTISHFLANLVGIFGLFLFV